jgi:cell fate regulator YaaT (PSP1 superfamily)
MVMSGEGRRPFVSVKFAPAGRAQTFLLDDLALEQPPPSGEPILVRTADGKALGTVTRTIPALAARREPEPGSPNQVVRRATREDIVTRLKHENREKEAHRICVMKIRERGLAMKLTRVEQLFDGSRLIFYFTSEGRVDFRELVRELAAEFRTRIEMRQIGVRDEAKMLGGYGSCGRPLCCTTWLNTFEPISIKMAKQQNLSLNPSKLSGQCGRLKCCLRYELPNGKGVKHGGCAHGFEGVGGCGTEGSGCGSGGCAGDCGSCGSR